MTLYTLNAKRCKDETTAQKLAREGGCCYGLCIFDGLFYVGTIEEISRCCVDVKTP